MHTLAGYHLTESLHESNNSLVYRGQRRDDNRTVVLKVLKDIYPSPERIAWFRHEYEITRKLDLPGVVSAYALENSHHHWIMVLEDFGGESLSRLKLAGSLTIDEWLHLAMSLTETLGQVHQNQMIHKDINPANIVYNRATHQVKLIDFGISTRLSRENPTFRNPNVLEGTLAYMSPEQTGRMNRALDYRTDFYSLGATLYELLTGQLPFVSDDALELVHSHIARQPIPPHHLKPTIPPMLSAIILKLMAKNAEDRYQSAYGLKADLETCLHQWQESKKIAPFITGQQDISDTLSIPQKLYGREHEVAMLLAAFERVSQGASELMLVSGAAGIGKSVLVQEIHRPVTANHGYFITGKFDQLQRNTPYSAIIAALQSLMRHILAEDNSVLAVWRERLQTALGANGQVVVEVIPEVGLIIGPQPEVPALGPAESLNRFTLVFQNLIQVFTSPEHPLILVLDDMQWADSASLMLLERLLTAQGGTSRVSSLLIIGTYRDTEVAAGHPLRLMVEAIQQATIPVHHLHLYPLDTIAITRLCVDALHTHDNHIQPLAELVAFKTGGNPFFLNEFLRSLYIQGIISFDYATGMWQWDEEQIQAQQMTDNVVQLLSNKVQRLNDRTRKMLELAACIGNHFSLSTLAMVANEPPTVTARILEDALVNDLIVPLTDVYKLMTFDIPGLADCVSTEYVFMHDRIHQAVYEQIPEPEQQAIHWHIGQLIVKSIQDETDTRVVEANGENPVVNTHQPSAPVKEHIFDIVHHLNQGRAHNTSQTERDHVALLNLIAGEKAKAAAAYEPAFNYLSIGLELLGSDGWQHHYTLALKLHTHAAAAAYLSGDIATMERLTPIVLEQARTPLDRIDIYEINIQAYAARHQFREAILATLPALAMFGITLPEQPTQEDMGLRMQTIQQALTATPLDHVQHLPAMTDPHTLAAMRILASLFSVTYIGAPALMPLVVFDQVAMSLRHGHAAPSPFAYANYGLMLCGVFGDIETGLRFGKLALHLLDTLDARAFKAKTLVVVNFFISHWGHHAQETLAPLLEGYRSGLETGDFEYAGYAAYMHTCHAFLIGKPLAGLIDEFASNNETFAQLQQERTRQQNGLYWQVAVNLRQDTENEQPWHIGGPYYNEDEALPVLHAANDRPSLGNVHFSKMFLCYFFEQTAEALHHAALTEQYLDGMTGSLFIPLFIFYDSLVHLAEYGNVSKRKQKTLWKKVTANQDKMLQWAHHAPMNYLHKWHLVEAERARVRGKDGDAREQYDHAITLARENGYLYEEALAHELAGKFYMAKGLPEIAHVYLRRAHYAYEHWGALAKVKHMEERYPELLIITQQPVRSNSRITVPITTRESTEQGTTYLLDLASVIKASQTISSEIVLDTLLARLMNTVIENAGAERGILILHSGGQWVVEAEGIIDQDEVTVLQSLPIEHAEVPQTVVNYVVRTGESVVLADAAHQGAFTQDSYIATYTPYSVLCSPLLHQGTLIGMLYLENNQMTSAFTKDRLEVLNLLSGQIAIAIENARLYASLQSSELRFRTLFESSRDTIFMTSPAGQFFEINPACVDIFGYTREEVLRMNARDLYANPQDRERFQNEIAQYGSVKDFAVTFRHKYGKARDCHLTATAQRAEDGSIEYYQGIIRDITEQKQAERERLRLTAIEQELNLAHRIQQSLLPESTPEWCGIDVVCYSMPAREVGGDLYAYHTFELSQIPEYRSRYAVAVGDVSGKGMPAALLMAVSLASFHSMAGQGLAPGALLSQMDQTLMAYTNTTQQNCAFVYVDMLPSEQQPGNDARQWTLRVANAGCVTPILKRRDGTVEWIDVGGMPLGVGFGAEIGYDEAVLEVSSGDLIILTSDGIIEANDATGELFSFERLEEAVASGPQSSAEAMLHHVRTVVEAFVGGLEAQDDVTIVVVQV